MDGGIRGADALEDALLFRVARKVDAVGLVLLRRVVEGLDLRAHCTGIARLDGFIHVVAENERRALYHRIAVPLTDK